MRKNSYNTTLLVLILSFIPSFRPFFLLFILANLIPNSLSRADLVLENVKCSLKVKQDDQV